jgi:hypothetical protein
VLRKEGFFLEELHTVRFSVTVPSARVALARIEDSIKFEELKRRHELGRAEHPLKLAEIEYRRLELEEKIAAKRQPKPPAPNQTRLPKASGLHAFIDAQGGDVNIAVAVAAAKAKKIAEVEGDPAFQSMTIEQRAGIYKLIEEQFDPAEIAAKWEMRGT